MDRNPYSTATMTKTVSGTKLLAATLALYAAGGVSLAVLPMATKSTTTTTSYTTTVVESSCTESSIYLSDKCVATYSSFTASCHDGRRFTQTLSSCKTAAEISTQAKLLCQGRSNPQTGKVGLNGYSVGTPCESTYKRAEMNCPSTGTTVVVTSSCAVASSLIVATEEKCSCISSSGPVLKILGVDNFSQIVVSKDFSDPDVFIGEFRVEALNDSVGLRKITFALRDGSNMLNIGHSIPINRTNLYFQEIDELTGVKIGETLSVTGTVSISPAGEQLLTFIYGGDLSIVPGRSYVLKLYALFSDPIVDGSFGPTVFRAAVYNDTSSAVEAYSDGRALTREQVGGSSPELIEKFFSPSGQNLTHNTSVHVSSFVPSLPVSIPNAIDAKLYYMQFNKRGYSTASYVGVTLQVTATNLPADGVIQDFKIYLLDPYDTVTSVGVAFTPTTPVRLTAANPTQTITFVDANAYSDLAAGRRPIATADDWSTTFFALSGNTTMAYGSSTSTVSSSVRLSFSMPGDQGYDPSVPSTSVEPNWKAGGVEYTYLVSGYTPRYPSFHAWFGGARPVSNYPIQRP